MISYPMIFKASAMSAGGIQTLWTAQSATAPNELAMAIPIEFAGPGGGYSPEDLYLLALENCYIATFKVFAEKSRLQYTQIKINAELVVDRDGEGRPWMSEVVLEVKLQGATQTDLALRLLERVSQNCLILNSVRTQKTFHFKIS